ncbi:hypothetical protein QR680_012221 [Steinernema hermaphroditum]|uniref:non-specific serine/threonine protein kinase n=1 Tax=Steinernema hermaphroditum TaxID=289476 RepID=A0AA39I3A1_9BILA|nr:hypothetical protein QR680_012221 [Steinernema hermaphroditum]
MKAFTRVIYRCPSGRGDMEQESAIDYEHGGLPHIEPGECIGMNYYVIRKLGWGNFSTVWLCWQPYKHEFYAVKIIKSHEDYSRFALDELKLLELVCKVGEVVRFVETFDLQKDTGTHICIVTEVLGHNLLYAIENMDYDNKSSERLRIQMVRDVARSLLQGLAELEKCDIVHTDIKPENVLFTKSKQETCQEALAFIAKLLRGEKLSADEVCAIDDIERVRMTDERRFDLRCIMCQIVRHMRNIKSTDNERCAVKIADLGNAGLGLCYESKEEIQTLQYRSPESILRAGYDYTADVFSAACTIFELATGNYLFDVRPQDTSLEEQEEHLTRMVLTLGDFPSEAFVDAPRYKVLFDECGKLRNPVDLAGCDKPGSPRPRPIYSLLTECYGWNDEDARGFSQLLIKMLRMDPKKRVTAGECLQHDWLTAEWNHC